MKNCCRGNPFCNLLDQKTREVFCQHVTITYQKAKQIRSYGRDGHFEIIAEGTLLKYTLLEDGSQKSIELLEKGGILGQHLLFENLEYPNYETLALTDIKICNYPIKLIKKFFDENKQFSYAFTQTLTKHLTNNQIFWIKIHSLSGGERVEFIYNHLAELGVDLSMITQEEIALIAGVSRITVARAMKRIEK